MYLNEKGAEQVADLLMQVKKGEAEGFINVFNLAEVYYITYRLTPDLVDEKIENLRLYGLKVIPVEDDELWVTAAKLKGTHALSLYDAFAVATAQTFNSQLVVGSDKEFRNVKISLLRIRD